MPYQLTNRTLLKFSGADAENFLQAQLSNDISKLDVGNAQLGAYCQHQGKILALFWVMRDGDDFLLSLPGDLVEALLPRLRMFVLMSDVVIEDISNEYTQIGHIGATSNNAYRINQRLSVAVVVQDNAANIEISSQDEWTKACIETALPEVTHATTELFVPQMLNLDIDEIGVNFTKGCYPGQEVVARLHYLGKAKRRLFAFKSSEPLSVGDSLYCESSKSAKASGIVVSQVKSDSEFLCLATLEVVHKDDLITLNGVDGAILTRIEHE
ncbi:MAG: folate-binding protein YgfZ [Gammaproteobacteria bacterium]